MIKVKLSTTGNGLFEITGSIRQAVADSGVKSGICAVWVPHTTAGLAVISRMDPLGFEDIEDEMDRLVPTRVNFKHQFDTPADAAGHIKSFLTGISQVLLVEDGKLQIGGSQGVFFFEFDGPRPREYWLQIIAA